MRKTSSRTLRPVASNPQETRTHKVVVRSRSFEPAPALREFVRLFRFLKTSATVGTARRPVIARTVLVMVFNLHHHRPEVVDYNTSRRRALPEVLLVGAQSTRRTDIVMTTGWTSFAVHFQPAGFYRLFHLSMRPFTNRILDAVEVLGSDMSMLHEQLRLAVTAPTMYRVVENYLVSRIAQAAPLHPVATSALKMIEERGRLSIGDLAHHSGLSQRQFERLFTEQMGMPPKVYARVARVSYVLQRKTLSPSLPWTRIAEEAGYCDYKHLATDFKSIVGTSPSAYLASPQRLDDGFLLSRKNIRPRNP